MLFFNAYAFSEPTKKKEKTVKMTTCRLASQLIVNNQRVCLFLGANNTESTCLTMQVNAQGSINVLTDQTKIRLF